MDKQEIEAAIAAVHERHAKEIARLQAKLGELPPEVDLSEAVEAFNHVYHERLGTAADALIAAYPALHKALGKGAAVPWPSDDALRNAWSGMMMALAQGEFSLGNTIITGVDFDGMRSYFARRLHECQQANAAPEPTEAEDLAMARKIMGENSYIFISRRETIAFMVAAIKAERRRAQGEQP